MFRISSSPTTVDKSSSRSTKKGPAVHTAYKPLGSILNFHFGQGKRISERTSVIEHISPLQTIKYPAITARLELNDIASYADRAY